MVDAVEGDDVVCTVVERRQSATTRASRCRNERDRAGLSEGHRITFALNLGVDMVALSFVSSRPMSNWSTGDGSGSGDGCSDHKLEKSEAIDNLEAIVLAFDARHGHGAT